MTKEVRYLCLGHPSWPGNLSMLTFKEAADWFNDHREQYPVYVEKVVTERVRLISPGPAVSTHEFGYDVNAPELQASLAARRAEAEAIHARNAERASSRSVPVGSSE
jgi:hypothetical protein